MPESDERFELELELELDEPFELELDELLELEFDELLELEFEELLELELDELFELEFEDEFDELLPARITCPCSARVMRSALIGGFASIVASATGALRPSATAPIV
ncbi:hypothetical protein OIU34_35655 [Pararhizobium sp. BT-229]|uniref:hypothetical protein n=1 Tax=Pararhizobium sp. BT-229 TaxID=2986923 RepID=UPI0021F7369B|nr:hypothetical protein [Pararhizobium sp. BT-229]MCV9967171.1 hypothetical protein [Pararhizobium sp. BT-229]